MHLLSKLRMLFNKILSPLTNLVHIPLIFGVRPILLLGCDTVGHHEKLPLLAPIIITLLYFLLSCPTTNLTINHHIFLNIWSKNVCGLLPNIELIVSWANILIDILILDYTTRGVNHIIVDRIINKATVLEDAECINNIVPKTLVEGNFLWVTCLHLPHHQRCTMNFIGNGHNIIRTNLPNVLCKHISIIMESPLNDSVKLLHFLVTPIILAATPTMFLNRWDICLNKEFTIHSIKINIEVILHVNILNLWTILGHLILGEKITH